MYNTQRYFTEDISNSFKNNYINFTNKKKYFDEDNLIFTLHRRNKSYHGNILAKTIE